MLKNIFFFSFLIFFIGCSTDNNLQINQKFSNEKTKLDEIFSDFMNKNDDYPYLYTYEKIRWRWSGDLKTQFESKIEKICKSKHGNIVYIYDFLNEYGLVEEKFHDRCIGDYLNSKIAREIFPYGGGTLPELKLCVINKKPIPKVLFAFGDDFHTFNHTRIRELVCLPNENNWNNNFKISHAVYQMRKKREEELRKQEEERKKREEELRKKLQKKENKEIKFFNNFIKQKKMSVNYISNPYQTKLKISDNNKFYISLYKPFIFNNKICGAFKDTIITPILESGENYSNYPNKFGGKVEFEDIICFNFKNNLNNINNIGKSKKFQYIFEVSPINKSLTISSNIKIYKNCFHNRYLSYFDTYCINGVCSPLQYVLNKLKYDFPKNKDLIITLPHIECDLKKYYFSPNYVNRIIVLNPNIKKVKDIFYFNFFTNSIYHKP